MEAPVDLSVVIPCRNAARHLPELLDALARERPNVPWEVVIVDNASTDATRAVALRHAGALPVRVVAATRGHGAGYARNVGAAAATGEHLLFLDHDDLVAPGYVSAMHHALATADIVGARLDSRALNPEWASESRPDSGDALLDHFGFLPYVPSGAMGVRKRVFEELQGFAEFPFAEDVDFCWRAQLAGKQLRAVPEAVVQYRYRPTLAAMFAQARRWGQAQARLHRCYRDTGMPGRSPKQAARDWRGLLVTLAYTRRRADVARAVFLLGVYLGRLIGSLRYRVVYL